MKTCKKNLAIKQKIVDIMTLKKKVQDGTSQLHCCAMAPGGFSINVWMVQIYDHNRVHFNESKAFCLVNLSNSVILIEFHFKLTFYIPTQHPKTKTKKYI